MRLFQTSKDGGPESRVWAHTLIEVKPLFSVILLRFENGSRDAYHSHAFNSISWVLQGQLTEHLMKTQVFNIYRPSLRPVITRRDTFHKVLSVGRTWVLTFRGPWSRTWREFLPNEDRFRTLTHGRTEVN